MSLHAQHWIYFILTLLAILCWLLATVNVVFPRPRADHPSPRVPFQLVALGLVFFAIPTACIYAQTL